MRKEKSFVARRTSGGCSARWRVSACAPEWAKRAGGSRTNPARSRSRSGRARGLRRGRARLSPLGSWRSSPSIEGFRVTPKRDSETEPRSFASVTHLHISQVPHRALAEVVGDRAGLVEGEQDRLLHVVRHRGPLDLARLRQRNHSPNASTSAFRQSIVNRVPKIHMPTPAKMSRLPCCD